MIPETPERRLYAALRGLFLVSQGTTQNFEARIRGTKEHHGPAGDSLPAYDAFALKWVRAKGKVEKLEVVEEAEAALANWKRQPEPPDRLYEYGTLAWKRLIATDTRGAAEVARLFGVSRQTVYNYRRDYAS